jgi:uncharacterized RDD family membrane protein YckC
MRVLKLPLLALAVAVSVPAAPSAQDIDVTLSAMHPNNPALRVGQDYTLKAGEVVRDVAVIAGDATIAGRVDRDVVVALGKVTIESTAVIEGSLVILGGTVVVAEGAQVREDLFVIGGFEGVPGFNPGKHHVVIGTAGLGAGFRSIVPWLTYGLLWGRPIVPWLAWVWPIAGLFFLVNLLLNLVFDTPVRASALMLRATPLSAFMTGLLVMLLAGPICVLLAVSVIGIAVVPFVLAALLLAVIIGKIGFARWIGMTVVRQDEPENRAQSMRSFLIGSAIMCIAYMVPVLGFLTWTLAGVFGLGSATLAFFSAYRRENPKQPRKVKTAPPADSGVVPPPQYPPSDAAPSGATPSAATFATAVPLADEPLYAAIAPPADSVATHVASELVMLPRAAFLERLAAFALDLVLVLILVNIFDFDRYDRDWPASGFLIALMYHVGFWTWKGTTLGGIICQLRLVRVTGGSVQFADALVRGLTGIFSLVVLGLGFLWILKDPDRQAWHDRVAGTYVVKVPRDWPI